MIGLTLGDTINIGKFLERLRIVEADTGITMIVDGTEIWEHGEHIATVRFDFHGDVRIEPKI